MKPLSPQKIHQLQQMLRAAEQARASGMISQAEGLYRDVLKQAPEAWDVRQQFAILFAATGRSEEAAKQFRLIVQANPTHAPSHANLATALSESNQLNEAITEFQRAFALDPGLHGAKIAYAETLRRAKRCEESAAAYKSVLDGDKTNHAAFNGLGLVYRDMEDFPRALECFEYAVGLEPKNHEYRINFAAALRRATLPDLATEQFLAAIDLKPDWLEAVVLLGEVLQEQHRYDEARECFERAQQLKPGEPELSERIGFVYLDLGDSEHAIKQFSEVAAGFPGRYIARLGLGQAHLLAGHGKDAVNVLEALVEEFPEREAAYSSLASSRKFSPDDAVIGKLQNLAERINDDAESAISLNFALGKIFDDCKDWEQAWKYYEHGNRLKNAEYDDYQPEELEARLDALMSVFTREFIEAHQNLGVPDNLPVMIVGMPRSGTTLTEQIISSHPKVIGAGEVVFWTKAEENVPHTLKTQEPYPACMSLMQPEHARQLVDRYTALLRKIAGPGTDPARITDKLPHNFVQLGLIALLLPNVPIIHCKRDAMDNCLSIFFQNFGAKHNYAYDLHRLGHHYRQYERLMAHWHKVLPGRILDVQYEDTIADPEYWSRKLIDTVGLEWDDACLAPHKLERTVKTASLWQVRQPIYKTSVARWKHYEPWLEPLKKSLGLA
ncbi:MAG: sulfotransferase [Methylobacillus sp.]|jgi:tetratricopeptide (TPR) repeat protein|nr:sulfotransferase [Methylobacillus sp.]